MITDTTAKHHLEQNHAMETVLHRLASDIRRTPDRARYGIVDHGGRFQIGLEDVLIRIPVIGLWPLRDLTPGGVADMLDALAEDASRPSSHEGAIQAYAHEALCIAIATETIQEDAIRDVGGGFLVELCLEEGTHDPYFWIGTNHPDRICYERLNVDPGHIESTPIIPCHFYEGKTEDGASVFIMTESCSDSEGIGITSLRIDPNIFASIATRYDENIDPVSILRMLRDATTPTRTVEIVG